MAATADPVRQLLGKIVRAAHAVQGMDASLRLDVAEDALLPDKGWEREVLIWEPGKWEPGSGWLAKSYVYRYFGTVRVNVSGAMREATREEIHEYLARAGRLVEAPPPPVKQDALPASKPASALPGPAVGRALPASKKPIALPGPAVPPALPERSARALPARSDEDPEPGAGRPLQLEGRR